jgi:hypothetical protein
MRRRQLLALVASGTLIAGALALGQPLVVRAANVYVVNSNVDLPVAGVCSPSVPGTLRDCIAAANTAGGTNTITFAPTVILPIVLNNTSGALHITGPQTLTIAGNGQATTIIDGNANQRVFDITNATSVTMTDLTVRNGKFINTGAVKPFDGGGGISTGGDLTLDRVAVTGNQALSDATHAATSGGILDWGTGTVTIRHSTISSNTVSSVRDAAGGAIQDCCGVVGGHVTISDTTISGNTATTTTGQAFGGAIANNDATLSITRTTFSDNSATQTGNSGSGGVGGSAIVSHGVVDIDLTLFHHNTTTAARNLAGGSGTIEFCCTSSGSLAINHSAFDHNSVDTPGGSSGAAVSASGGTKTSISNSTFESNSVAGPGSVGGAIHIDAPTGTTPFPITNSTFTGNSATGITSVGGGVVLDGGGSGSDPFALVNDTINGNTAPSASGANLFVRRSQTATVVNTIVAGTTADNCHLEPGAVLTDAGHNLDDGTPSTCGFTAAAGDVVGADPKLGPIGDNGGPTRTEALLTGSPALDAASNASCPTTDQRGLPRTSTVDPVCDIGAFELQKATPVAPTGAGVPVPLALILILGGIAVVVASAGRRRGRRIDS